MAAMSFVECKRSMLVLLLFQLLSKEKYKCYKMRGEGQVYYKMPFLIKGYHR
jgi:hypothetical protein